MKPVLDIRRADDTSALFDFKCGVKSMDDFIHDSKDGLAKFIKLRLSNLWIVFVKFYRNCDFEFSDVAQNKYNYESMFGNQPTTRRMYKLILPLEND